MATTPHPLQTALDRTTAATYSAVDLIDIAHQRKATSVDGKITRPDARQVSLYHAAIASSVAAIEDSFEGLTLAGIHSLGVNHVVLERLATVVGRALQSPQPDEIDKLMSGFFEGFRPSEHWSADLRYSEAAYRKVKRTGNSHRYIHTIYNPTKTFRGKELADAVSRFVKMRNSFAHQDASVTLFNKQQKDAFKRLRAKKASSRQDIEMVEAINATCAVVLDAGQDGASTPLVEWTVHETHAINSLCLCIGLVMSSCSALADHLGMNASKYEPLHLCVQKGRWSELAVGILAPTPGIDLHFAAYKPKSRVA